VTDESGRFEYPDLTAGRFILRVRGGPGYRWTTWGQQTPWDFSVDSTQHELRADERLTDIVMKLPPSGSISGTVRDEHGEPIVKASLHLFERQANPGTAGWDRTTVSATTDDRGMYRLGDRPLGNIGQTTLAGPGPGEYVIVVTAPGPTAASAPAFAGAVFSGGTRSISAAQVISLGIGEHRPGVDIVVTTRPGSDWAPLRGQIVNSTVLRGPLTLRLVPAGALGELANFLEITATAGIDGRFTFDAVPAGDYWLRGWQFPEGVRSGSPPLKAPAGPTWLVDLPVHVDATGPVQDHALTLRAAARITGRVIFDGDSQPPALGELRLMPLVDHPDPTVGMVRTHVEPDGRFSSPGLLPGRYFVYADTRLRRPDRPIELLWWTSSMFIDGREADEGTIQLAESDIEVAITLTDRRAGITGTVRDSRGLVRPDARVIMLGRDPVSTERCLRIVAPDRFGVFDASGLSRDCLLSAVINLPRVWQAPDYLETLRPFAVPVRVGLGETRTVDLTVRP
jgi:hypothetical protein